MTSRIKEQFLRLPWWWGLPVAAASLLFSAWLGQPDPTRLSRILLHGVLTFGLPALLVLGSAISIWARHPTGEPVAGGAHHEHAYPQRLSRREVVLVIGEILRRQGYEVFRTGLSPTELMASKDHKRLLIECQYWRKRKVGLPVLCDLQARITEVQGVGGFVLASGIFTVEAAAYASSRNIRVLDARRMVDLVNPEAIGKLPAVPVLELSN